ncbi:MAG: ATP-grasp domain-containing protein, partial [Chthoniobacterales bacterium]|nr:ATP-grasp domain-containing protein [Chthoniobacterales bacterium]
MGQNASAIAIYYEHPDWFRPLFAELDRRGTPYIKLDARRFLYDVTAQRNGYALLFNRMSASAYLRGHGHAVLFTRDYLSHLERCGMRVINGAEAFSYEISKAAQLSLLQSLGIAFPRSRIVNHVDESRAAAAELGFPLIIKPNVGGRGAGIVRLNSAAELDQALAGGMIDLGIDNTALVQEFIPARGGHIHRVETLGGKFLYAMKVFTTGENFNLCPAEICQTENAAAEGAICLADGPKAGLKIEPYQPHADVIEMVERIVAAGGIDVGGIEYIIDDRDGRLLFYDINALSNFVADAPRILGFDPHARLVDYLEQERNA